MRLIYRTFELCLPTVAKTVPTASDYLHEIKYDGYRLLVIRDHDRVRLITRGGNGWAKRFPWIVEAALKNRAKQLVIVEGGIEFVLIPNYAGIHALAAVFDIGNELVEVAGADADIGCRIDPSHPARRVTI